MKAILKSSRMLFADIQLLFLLLLSVTAVSVFCRAKTAIYNDTVSDLSEGWNAPDGTIYNLENLPDGEIALTHSLKGIDLRRMRLCFESTDTHFTAKFDGEVIYTYYPKLAPVLGKSYGRYIHLIPIPPDAESVTLKLHPIYSGESATIKGAVVEDAGGYIAELYHNELPKFALCFLLVLFGILMIILGFTDHITDDSKLNSFSLGVFAVFVGIWSANDTMVLQIFTQHPEIVSFTRYLCLMFVVYLPVSFMASSTNHRKTVLLPILLSLTILNFAATMALSISGIADMHQMLPFSHINIVIALLMTISLMLRAIRQKILEKDFVYTVVIAMSFASVGVAADLLRYLISRGKINDTSCCTRIGVLMFVGLLGIHLIRQRTHHVIQKERAEIMEKLAYNDSLTGLANRASFHEKENEIRQQKTGCCIVQLDINNLKKVNDIYGHAEGDRHIINAAHIIRDCFHKLGASYRTGGDEFIVIIMDDDISAIETALHRIDESAEQYNAESSPPVPMQIAYGYAQYDPQTGTLEDAEHLADQRMYQKKHRMKSSVKSC